MTVISDSLVLLIIFLISSQALTCLYLFEILPGGDDKAIVAVAGIVFISLFIYVPYKLFKYMRMNPTWMSSFFIMVCWSARIDLILAGTSIGFWKLGNFYVINGEEYFKTSWGVAALLWDGTFHFVLQLLIAFCLLRNYSCQILMLIWSGSIIQSMPVLLLGAATGVYSDKIHFSTALNIPYVLCPVLIAAYALNVNKSDNILNIVNNRNTGYDIIIRIFLIMCHALSIVIIILRAMVVMHSKTSISLEWGRHMEPVLLESSGFIIIQSIQSFFYYIPYHGICIFILLSLFRRKVDIINNYWMFIFSGGYLQSQFCFILTAFFKWSEYKLINREIALQSQYPIIFILINASLPLVSLFQAFYYQNVQNSLKNYNKNKDH